jgi:hypothetical protein
MGLFHARSGSLQPATFVLKLRQADRLVENGQAGAFACAVFRSMAEASSVDKVISVLRLAKADEVLTELLPSRQRDPLDVSKYFAKAGLAELGAFINERSLKHVAVELTSMMAEESDCADIASAMKTHQSSYSISAASCVQMLYQAILGSITWSKRTEQHSSQFVNQFKTYGPAMAPHANTNKIQIDLINRIQVECAERNGLIKAFLPVIQTLYKCDVLGEEAVTRWAKGGAGVAVVTKGRPVMLEEIQPFLNWLAEAEEEEEEEEDEDK